MTARELEAIIRRASNRMRADDNTKLITKYIEHLSWLLFLKVHEAIEDERQLLDGAYVRLIDGDYRWSEWTTDANGWRADELITFVNDQLFPHLRGLNGGEPARLIASLFQGIGTVMKSGYGLKEVIAEVDKIDFHEPQDVHTFSVVYESLLARLGRDASWSGEFYTPRPIVRFMVRVTNPRIGEKVYDPAAGSAGFLAEAFEHMRGAEQTLDDHERLRTATFFGRESGELPFLLGTMNLILHGVSVPNIARGNTLETDVRGISPDRQFEIILTNPPFGGRENSQIQQNFPARSAATEALFMQHVFAFLSAGGRASVVVPDGILFREYAAFTYVRRRLIDDLNLTAVVRLGLGAFPYAPDTRTNLLFFEKAPPTTEAIRFYHVRPPAGKRAFTKTRPITDELLAPALAWVQDGVADGNGWEVDRATVRAAGYDLDIPPPDEARELAPEVVLSDVAELRELTRGMVRFAEPLQSAAEQRDPLAIRAVVDAGTFVEERGARAGTVKPTSFIGVSNSGGLVAFKGEAARNTSRYRRVEKGDFVYNPMRVNVGSIALCRSDDEAGYASPDYVVFRLKADSPISPDYFLAYLRSSMGLREIARNAQGTIRSRLYFANLCQVKVPVPHNPASWVELLDHVRAMEESLAALPTVGGRAIQHLLDSLFASNGQGLRAELDKTRGAPDAPIKRPLAVEGDLLGSPE